MPKVILEPDAEGNIVITKETLERLGSNQAELRVEGGRVTLEGRVKVEYGAKWRDLSYEAWAKQLDEWLESIPTVPSLSDEAISRDSIYD